MSGRQLGILKLSVGTILKNPESNRNVGIIMDQMLVKEKNNYNCDVMVNKNYIYLINEGTFKWMTDDHVRMKYVYETS